MIRDTEFAEAIKAWNRGSEEQLVDYLRGRLTQIHRENRDLKDENIHLVHENTLLREGHIDDSVSWIMAKNARQRQELRRLRKLLGYKDDER